MKSVGFLLLAFVVPLLSQEEAVHNLQIAARVAFTEGPTVDRDGNVYFSDTVPSRIMRLDADEVLSVFRENSNGANGLIFDDQWRLVACEGNKSNARVTRTDMATGKVEVLVDSYLGKPLDGPNDVTIDGKGRLYFTDRASPGNGSVYRIDADGTTSRILTSPEIEMPNGIAISPDDKILYLVESNNREGGARMIRAYDLSSKGTVSEMRVFVNFYPGRSADGITVDSQGNVYAAAGLNHHRGTHETLDTKGGVHVFSPEGKVINFIPIPEDTITNVAFGRTDLKTLYVTAGKTLYKLQTNIAGTRR